MAIHGWAPEPKIGLEFPRGGGFSVVTACASNAARIRNSRWTRPHSPAHPEEWCFGAEGGDLLPNSRAAASHSFSQLTLARVIPESLNHIAGISSKAVYSVIINRFSEEG